MADGCTEWMLGLVEDDDNDRQDLADEEQGDSEPRQQLSLCARARRAILPLLRRRRQRQPPRFHYGEWPRSKQVGIRRKSDTTKPAPARTKASLENLRTLLADTLRYTDLIETNENMLTKQRESLVIKQNSQPPLQYFEDAEMRQVLNAGVRALDAVQTAKRNIEAQEPELLRVLADVAGDKNTVLVTPTFNTQARDLLAVLVPGLETKTALEILSEDLRIHDLRVRQIETNAPYRGRGWFWNQRLFSNSVQDLREKVAYLEKSNRSYRLLIEQRRNILLRSQTTKEWAQKDVPAARLAAAERYTKNIQAMLEDKGKIRAWRLSTRSFIERQALEAGQSFEDHFLQTIANAVQNVAVSERNFVKARRLALRQNVALQAVPYAKDDDPISEVAWTLPDDMHSGSENEAARASEEQALDRAGIDSWIPLPNDPIEVYEHHEYGITGRTATTGSYAPFLDHEEPAVPPSVYSRWSGSSTEVSSPSSSRKSSTITSNPISIHRR